MNAFSCAAGACVALTAQVEPESPWAKRLANMQADLDRIAAGQLPIRPSGRNATASDVNEYLRGQRASVRV